MTKLEQIAQAMRNSKAWPAVFGAGAAEELARVALEAMQEPTKAMMTNARAATTGYQAIESVTAVYKAAIQAALNESPEHQERDR